MRRNLIRFKSAKKRSDENISGSLEEAVTVAERPKDKIVEDDTKIWLEENLEEHRTKKWIFFDDDFWVNQRVYVTSSSIYHSNPGSTSIRRRIDYTDVVGMIYFEMPQDEKKRNFRDIEKYSREYCEADPAYLDPLCFAVCTTYCGFFRGRRFVFKVKRYCMTHMIQTEICKPDLISLFRREDLELWFATFDKIFTVHKDVEGIIRRCERCETLKPTESCFSARVMNNFEILRLKTKLFYLSDVCQIFTALLV